MYCDSWYSGYLVGGLGAWTSPGNKVKIIKSSWSRLLAWPSCPAGGMWVAVVGYTNLSTWVTWQGSKPGSRQGGRSAYQELCLLKPPEVLLGEWDPAIQGVGVGTRERWLFSSLSGKLWAGPAGVLPFDILVWEDGELSISGVKLLLEITETLCLKVYPHL